MPRTPGVRRISRPDQLRDPKAARYRVVEVKAEQMGPDGALMEIEGDLFPIEPGNFVVAKPDGSLGVYTAEQFAAEFEAA